MPKTVTVTNSKDLLAAAKKAGAGDTILLAAGNYGDVSFAALRPAGPVTIKSADANHDAVFDSLKLTRSSNFIFDDIDINHVLKPGENEWAAAAAVNLSDNISFVGVDFSGSMNNNRFDDGNGLLVTSSSRIAVINSTFQQFNNAAGFGITNDIVFAGNTISGVREGVNMAQITGALFERNFVTDIVPDVSKGDHSDAFQVHAGGVRGASSDIVFRSNVILSDSQGIFIRSEKAAEGITHSNIVVENNFYEGNSRNAITVANVVGVEITGNSIREGAGAGLAPGIVIGGLTGAVISNNIAPLLVTRTDFASTNVRWTDNIDTMDSAQKKGVSVESVFASRYATGDIDFASLDARSTTMDVSGIGFRSLAGIGHIGGTTASLLASYVPMFDQHFANVHLV